jgi:hypothetical protein
MRATSGLAHLISQEKGMPVMRIAQRSLISMSIVAAVTAGLSLTGAASAQAADKGIGALKCLTLKEIHTLSNSRGDVTHQIYGAKQPLAAWETTNSVKAGYSSGLVQWNVHHWLFYTMKSGKVFGSEVKSASARCE